MSGFEFKVVPAPKRARKLTGLAKGEDRFCATLTDVITDLGLDGWEFVGAETLPHVRRLLGLFRRREERGCLVFRRRIEPLMAETKSEAIAAEAMSLLADDDDEEVVKPKRVMRKHVVPNLRGGGRLTLIGSQTGKRPDPDNLFKTA